MGAPENIVTNASKIAYTDYFPIDKCVYSSVTTISVTNSVGSYTVDVSIPTNGGDKYLRPLGIYSYDNGITWSDLGYSIPGGSLNKNPNLITPSVGVGITYRWDNDTVRFSVTVKATVGSGATIPINISFVLLDGDTGASFNNPPPQSGKVALSNLTATGLPVQYRQILLAGANPTNTASRTDTVAHGAGAIPLIMVWMDGGSNTTTIQGMFWDARNIPPGSSGSTGPYGVAVDSTNLYFVEVSGNIQPNYLYRVYREN